MRQSGWRRWQARLWPWGRGRRDREMAEEIAAHLALEAEELEAEGLAPAQASAAARRAFGNRLLALEDSRAEWRWRWADELGRDLRLAGRSLARNRGFAVAAIVILALGIAAFATMFSLVDALLLTPVPVAHPERMVIVSEYYAHNGGYYLGDVSAPDYQAFRRRVTAFSGITAASFPRDANLELGGSPRPVRVQRVRPNFFAVLGVRPQLGRAFLPAAAGSTQGRGAILSAQLWRERFAASPAVLGRQIVLGQRSYTVIGVMPPAFRVPRAMADIWVPLRAAPPPTPATRDDRDLTVYARLAPGVTLRQASAQITAVMAQLARRYRADHEWRVMLHPINGFYNREAHASGLMALTMSAAGLLLLLACANIAGLLLARAAARRHELALRAALGAGRARLARQLLAEAGLLAVGGCGLGLLIAIWAIRAFAAQLQTVMPLAVPSLDWRVAVFAVAVSALAVVVFGLAPAWQAAGADPQAALQDNARGAVGGQAWLRHCLAVGQVALALVLLTAAGLMLGVVARETSPAAFGFNPRHLTVASFRLPRRPTLKGTSAPSAAAWAADANAIAARLRHLPGVTAAATAYSLPLNSNDATSLSLQPHGPTHGALFYQVSPDYFAAMQIPLLRGRDFTPADIAAGPALAIVDRRFVRQYFHGRNPVGRTVYFHYFDYLGPHGRLVDASLHRRPVVIAGVCGPVQRYMGLVSDEPAIYVPLRQWPARSLAAVIRSAGAPPTAAVIGRAILSVAGPRAVVAQVSSMRAIIAQDAGGDLFVAGLIGAFAALALVLAAAGIFGVIAYAARRRTPEIGVRLALGARRADIARMILGEAAVFGGAGWLIGLGVAALLPRLLWALFGAIMLPSFAAAAWPAALLIPLAVVVAAYLPARRAARLDPAQCLRRE